MAKATNLTDSLRTKTLKYTHTAAVAEDDIILLGGRVLIAFDDYLANAEGVYVHGGERVEAPKAAVALTSGETAYWDNGAANFTNVVGTNTKCGIFVEDKLGGDALCVLELDNSVNY